MCDIFQSNCSMFGCSEVYYNSITMGPGTYVGLCQAHFTEEIREEKSMVSVTPKEYLDVLKEWNKWVSSYYSLIGPRPELVELINKTVDIIARGEMK